MKYYKNFSVKVSHPYAFDDQLFNLSISERLPIAVVRAALRTALRKSCYDIKIKHKLNKSATHQCNSIASACKYISTIILHQNTIEYQHYKESKLLIKFYDRPFRCSDNYYNGNWYTFFRSYDGTSISRKAIQELFPNELIGISRYGDPYILGRYSWFAVLNDTKWETWLGEVIMKTKEIHTTKEI